MFTSEPCRFGLAERLYSDNARRVRRAVMFYWQRARRSGSPNGFLLFLLRDGQVGDSQFKSDVLLHRLASQPPLESFLFFFESVFNMALDSAH